MSKRIKAFLLVMCMLCSMFAAAVPAYATNYNSYFTMTPSSGTVSAGDTITITLSNNALTCSSFVTGIMFDSEKVECTSFAGTLEGMPEYFMLEKVSGNSIVGYYGMLGGPDNVAAANAQGAVGFQMGGNTDVAYKAGDIAKITFIVKDSASGSIDFTIYEACSSDAGYATDEQGGFDTKSLTVYVAHTHVYDQENTSVEGALKTAGTCMDEAVYYMSCACGELGTGTFKGEKDPENHVDGCVLEWKYDADEHWQEYKTCGAKGEKADHTGGEATCKAKAICGTCGAAYGDLNATNHKGETELRDKVNPSCNEPGYSGDTWCLDCETKIATGAPVAATGNHVDADDKWESNAEQHYHTCACGTEFDKNNHTGGEATCKAKAICETCGVAYGDLNATNHKGETELRDKVNPSCNEPGYSGDTWCLDCETKIATGAPVAATGNHVDADDKWESNAEQHYHTCACGTEFDKNNHTGGEATCKAKAICETCGAAYGNLNANNHKGETELVNAKEANCNETGYTGDVRCLDCGEIKDYGTTIEKDMNKHILGTPGNMSSDATGHWGICGAGHVIDKVAHSGGVATCTTDGTCATCNYPYIPALGHSYSEAWTSDATHHWHACANGCGTKDGNAEHSFAAVAEEAYLKSEATCSAKAVYYKSCVCGAKSNETFESGEKAATAHKWNDQGICEHNDKHIKFEKEPGEKVEDVIEGLVSGDITVKELVEGVLKPVEALNTLFKDGAIKIEEGKLVYELLPDAPEGEYYIEITVGNVVYVVNVVVAEESVIVDRPDRPSYNSSAVKKVIEMIDELPSAKKVTLDDEEDIEAARKAYEKLSKADKAKVTNYEDLVEVEEALEALKNAAPEVIDNPFVDVDDDAYYADAVLWAVENAITSGTSTVTFSPDAVCTRAQVVTFLWRAAGCPAPLTSEMPFVDVEAGAYYAAAVQWAVENNITAGTSATTFDPNGKCTRGQIVTFLWRAQGNPAAAAVNNFVDVEDGAYYNAPVLWAVANGITNGTSTTTFSPAADCTRAQVVTFIYRCMAE